MSKNLDKYFHKQMNNKAGLEHSSHRTKIVATVGPACDTYEKLLGLVRAGVNVFRLNFSHGSHEDKAKIIVMGDMNIPFAFFVHGLKWRSLAAQRTFPSWYPKLQIDFILSQKLKPSDVRHIQYPHLGISDHLPLQIEVDVN